MFRTPDILSNRPISRREFFRQSAAVASDPHAAAINAIIAEMHIPLQPIVLDTKNVGMSIEIILDNTQDPRYIDEDGDYTDTYNIEVMDPIRQAMAFIFENSNDWTICGNFR